MSDDDPDLDAAYGLKTPDDNRRLYAGWAETYDAGFARESAYVLHLRVAEAYAAAGGDGPVIDLGAGTGLCGEALAGLGVAPLEATDLSAEMLARAEAKGVYARVFTGNLLERLPVADGSYAGAVSSGTFTHGHVGPEALTEVLRVLRPGGIGVISVNAGHWAAKGFEQAFAELDLAGFETQTVRIYGRGSTGPHADDVARIVTFRKG